jgi:hypothetical protein
MRRHAGAFLSGIPSLTASGKYYYGPIVSAAIPAERTRAVA